MRYQDNLIYESYSISRLLTEETDQFLTENFPYLITEEEKESWLRTALKVIDPTGILSWGDLSRAYSNYEQDQSVINFTLLLIGIFNAMPNLGLLAFGAGGVGWAGVKAALKVAARKPSLIKSAGEKLLAFASKTPGVKGAFAKSVQAASSRGIINPKVGDKLIDAVRTGKLPSGMTSPVTRVTKTSGPLGALTKKAQKELAGGQAAAKAVGAIGGKVGVSSGTKVLAKRQALSRLLGTFGPSGVGSTYPGWAPQSILPRNWEDKIKGWFSWFAGGESASAITDDDAMLAKQMLLEKIRRGQTNG